MLRSLTGVAAGGGLGNARRRSLELTSSALNCLIHRSFYEAGFVKRERVGIAILHGRESGRCCLRLRERERRTDLPALGADRRLLLLSVSTSTTSIT